MRWIAYARRSMQRLGFLKLLVALSSKSSGSTLEAITTKFHDAITKRSEVPAGMAEQIRKYIEGRRLTKRYGAEPTKIELQDLYLSDPVLPSGSGAVTGDLHRVGYRHAVYVEIPAWATELRLLRERNYTATARGQVLLCLDPGLVQRTRNFDKDHNPFNLSTKEQFFFIFALIDQDGCLISRTFRKCLQSGSEVFSRADVGDWAAEALRELIEDPTIRSKRGAAEIERIRRVLGAVKNQSKNGLGPRESLATPRTEPLVDCGLLRRAAPLSYSYSLTKRGRRLFQGLSDAESSDTLSEFVCASLASNVGAESPAGQPEQPLQTSVAEAYESLKSGLGYVAIRELALLAAAQRLGSGQGLLEIAHVEAFITERARRHGPDIRLAHSRQGGVGQVRISGRIIQKLKHGELD